jgi:serine/threonine-protein kinase
MGQDTNQHLGSSEAGSGATEVSHNTITSLEAIAPEPFGKYILIGKLGHGGMAEVNLAVAAGKSGFRKLLVVKRIHKHLSSDPDFVAMFLDEARLAALLDHPNCVHTIEVGEVNGQHFMAMEYLHGRGLERLLRQAIKSQSLLPVPIVVRIIADALDGLSYAHELTGLDGKPLGIVHRDISPQNIFVTYTGVVKLLDFGIAKAETNIVETRTGIVKGKYAYIAPEQARGNKVDGRADLWSMGVVLWELLTARRLFKGTNEIATLHETLSREIVSPSVHNPEVPPEIDEAVHRALQRKVENRYASAAEFKEALEKWLRSLPDRPDRSSIAAMMNERFGDVIKADKERLAACLEAVSRDAASIERLVTRSDSLLSSSGQFPAMLSGQFAALTPSQVSLIRDTAQPAERPKRLRPWLPVGMIVAAGTLAAALALLFGPSQKGELGLGTSSWTGRPGGTTAPTGPAPSDAPAAAPVGSTPTPTPTPASASPTSPTSMVAAEGAAPAPSAPVALPAASSGATPSSPAATPTLAEGRHRGSGRRATASEQSSVPSPRATANDPPTTSAASAGTAPATAPTPSGPSEPTLASLSAPSSSEQFGFLTLMTSPWTRVALNGRDLGETPLIRVRLPVGRHTLRLVNPDEGISETYEVEIRAGETTTRRLGLEAR